MPFYEYQCSRCGHHHEALQRVSDKPLRKCPECGRSSLARLMSAPVFRLKGGGWYETDFKSDKDAKRNLAGEKEPVEAKADAKPAAETKPDVQPAPTKDKPAADKSATDKPAVGKPQGAKPAPASSGPKKAGGRNRTTGKRTGR